MAAFAWTEQLAALARPAPQKVDLIYWLQAANEAGESRHALDVMADLRIGYDRAIPQSMYDAWEFRGCTFVPEVLPDFLQPGRGAID